MLSIYCSLLLDIVLGPANLFCQSLDCFDIHIWLTWQGDQQTSCRSSEGNPDKPDVSLPDPIDSHTHDNPSRLIGNQRQQKQCCTCHGTQVFSLSPGKQVEDLFHRLDCQKIHKRTYKYLATSFKFHQEYDDELSSLSGKLHWRSLPGSFSRSIASTSGAKFFQMEGMSWDEGFSDFQTIPMCRTAVVHPRQVGFSKSSARFLDSPRLACFNREAFYLVQQLRCLRWSSIMVSLMIVSMPWKMLKVYHKKCHKHSSWWNQRLSCKLLNCWSIRSWWGTTFQMAKLLGFMLPYS